MKHLFTCLRNEAGAAGIEYALIAGWLSIVIVTSVGVAGTKLNTAYTSVATALK